VGREKVFPSEVEEMTLEHPIAVEFVDEIPRSASGKALRRLLRDEEWGGAKK